MERTNQYEGLSKVLKAADGAAEQYTRAAGANKLKVNMKHPQVQKSMALDMKDAEMVQARVRPDLITEDEGEQ